MANALFLRERVESLSTPQERRVGRQGSGHRGPISMLTEHITIAGCAVPCDVAFAKCGLHLDKNQQSTQTSVDDDLGHLVAAGLRPRVSLAYAAGVARGAPLPLHRDRRLKRPKFIYIQVQSPPTASNLSRMKPRPRGPTPTWSEHLHWAIRLTNLVCIRI